MISFASETDVPRPIAVKLLRLRLAIAQWVWVAGLRACVWLLVGWAACDFALDRLWHFDRAQRAICLATGMGLLVFMVWRRLVAPLRQPLSAEALCRAVEARHPQLADRLLAAVELARARHDRPTASSRRLVQAAIADGVSAAEPIDFAAIVDRSSLRSNLLWLGAGAFVVGGILAGSAYAQGLHIWFQRNVLLRDIHWPRQTQIELVDINGDRMRLARGDDWQQLARASGVVPDAMYVDFRSSAWRSAGSESMTSIGADAFLAELKQPVEPFEFRVRGGDSWTEWISVELAERPAVVALHAVATPPAYTRLPARELPAEQGTHELLTGTRLELLVQASRPLVQLELRPLPDAEASGGPRSAAGTPVASRALERRASERESRSTTAAGRLSEHAAEVIVGQPLGDAADRFRLVLEPGQIQSRTYVIELVDRQGLRSDGSARLTLRVAPDRPPEARARLREIGPLICPTALVPLALEANDDFALAAVRLAHTRRREGSDEAPQSGQLTLFDAPADSGSSDVPPAAPLPAAQATGAASEPDRSRWSQDFDWSLDALQLAPGMMVSFHLEAEDNDVVSGPHLGRSEDLVVKVVGEDDYRADLVRREKLFRGELEAELNSLRQLSTDTAVLAASSVDAETLTDADRQTLSALRRRQQHLAERLATLAAQSRRVAREIANNRIEPTAGPLQTRLLQQVAEPLDAVATGPCAAALAALDSARQSTTAAQRRDDALESALASQRQAIDKLQAVLQALVKSASFQEVVQLLQAILHSQQQLHDGTLKARDDALRQLQEPRR